MKPTDDEMFDGFRRLMAACGPTVNKHDKGNVLIKACIDRGLNTGVRIVRALMALGFNGRHVGMLLKAGRGENPERHMWKRDSDGHYSLHPEGEAQAKDYG